MITTLIQYNTVAFFKFLIHSVIKYIIMTTKIYSITIFYLILKTFFFHINYGPRYTFYKL